MHKYLSHFWAVATLTAAATLLSATSYAAPSCSSFLAKSEKKEVQLNPLEQIQEEINQAQTLDEANKLTYELVAFGNNVFDQAIDGIIAINTKPAKDQETAKKQAAQVQGLIEALQIAFRIPSYVMGFAIANRLEIEGAEAQKKLRAENRREAIGFDRTELAKDFHADKPPKQPIGFIYNYGNKKNKGDFFRGLINQMREKSLKKEQIAAEKEAQEGPSAPIGFIPPQQDASVDDTAPMNHIGFVEPSDTRKSFKKSDINQIVLNVQIGEFRVSEDSVRQPIGF